MIPNENTKIYHIKPFYDFTLNWTKHMVSMKEIDDDFVKKLFCIIKIYVFLNFTFDIHLNSSANNPRRGVGAPYGIEVASTPVACKKCSHTTQFSVLLVLVRSLLLFLLICARFFICFMNIKSILTTIVVLILVISVVQNVYPRPLPVFQM